ncbi:target of rapamycin kinase [Micromonas commoda]|uniref:Serine/threonine-protein kinase TOR n=1 Tax=Micromonas commoda (strain RCC299 / NOUM17 / CCMP2709) TaxID=296587 RepID=C1EJC3_MICCC|nr:target of rapamycin kinase [Micromonas commoda]ACO68161.1 target of rapamycin kinase [Micromonas commoda]|eukprot:XP_002506903.1 target of rapamycin kinase [Micromonas commoda]
MGIDGFDGSSRRAGGAVGLSLREHVEAEARNKPQELFARYMRDLYRRILRLINSPDLRYRLGGVYAIDQLTDAKLGENVGKINRFATYLRDVITPTCEPALAEAASRALGHLVSVGGALTADIVDMEVKRSIAWLRDPERARRYAAVLILRELARNAPTVFNVHVPAFIDAIWPALRDQSLAIREAAVRALRECLVVIEKRETRYRVQWYYRLYEETQGGLLGAGKPGGGGDRGGGSGFGAPSVERTHGSLLAFGEMLRHTGEFMLSRYKEVAETVLRLHESKERIVRRSVVELVPRLAAFSPARFAESYLSASAALLLATIRSPDMRDAGFMAVGDLAAALASDDASDAKASEISGSIDEGGSTHGGAEGAVRVDPGHAEALLCAGALARSMDVAWEPHVRTLLPAMFAGGLSAPLVDALEGVSNALPALTPAIQRKLIEVISSVLSPETQIFGVSVGGSKDKAVDATRRKAHRARVQLALRTLGTFPFGASVLLGFVRRNVVEYLDDDDPATRREAALTCCRLLEVRSDRLAQKQAGNGNDGVGGEFIMSRLLAVAVSDLDAGVRKAVLASFCRPCPSTDSHLGQADALRALFVTLNDENPEVRLIAIRLVGRLAPRNPAYALPALRRHLLQLLAELEHSTESHMREEGARNMAALVRSCERLVTPYISPILRVLMNKLRRPEDGKGSARAPAHIVGVREKAAVLGTIGELAQVGGEGVASFIPQLLVLIIDGVRVGSTRDVAIVTMGQLIESTGFVIRPFNEHPGLLSLMLRVLAEETGPVRAELLRTLGVLGALDPHAHRENEERIHGQGLLSMEGVRGVGRAGETKKPEELQSKAIDKTGASVGGGFPGLDGDDPLPSTNLTTASDNFYPTVALNALLRVLRDPSMASHHHMVVRSIMYIFKALGLNCVQYLPAVMPVVINVMNTCEDGLREFMLAQLTALVAIIRGHVRRYLDDILHIIHSFWGPNQLLRQMLRLCEELATALHDEFRRHLPDLLPRMIAVLAAAERSGNFSAVPSVLHALEAFGSAVDEHLHLMLPALVRLFRPGVAPVPTAIRAQVLRSLTVLLPRMQLADHASAVVHPLVRVLDGPVKELRRDALVALTSLANSLGQDFLLFLPLVRRTVKKRSMRDPVFERIVERLEAERVAGGAKNSVNTASGGTNRLGLTPNATTSGGGDRSSADSKSDVDIRGNSLHGGYSLRHLSLADPAAGLVVDESALRRAWESSQRSTKEDWLEWMRHLSVELLKQSPSPALRACIDLAMVQPHLARDLFCASFVSCWSELSAVHRDQLVRSLEAAFGSPTIPPEIVTTLLNLAEFCEHDEKPLPVDIRTLGMIAERCRAYAKALHYKETEFVSNPAGCVEAIIAINNQLQLPEAAMGVLVYAQAHLRLDIKEGWYEKLGRWDEALEAHARKADAAEATLRDAGAALEARREATLGQMRCLAALAEWEQLATLCAREWELSAGVGAPGAGGVGAGGDAVLRGRMAPLATQAAWHLGDWCTSVALRDSARNAMNVDDEAGRGAIGLATDVDFFRAILAVHRGDVDEAREHIASARDALGAELAALVTESYDRSYGGMIRVQQLTELEEVIEYTELGRVGVDAGRVATRRETMRRMWRDRIYGVQRKVEVWQALLAVRSLVLPATEETGTWLKFASLNRKAGRTRQAQRTLLRLLGYDPASRAPGQPGYGAGSGRPEVMLAYVKHQWSLGNRRDAFARLQSLVGELGSFLRLGQWRWAIADDMDDSTLTDVLTAFRTATDACHGWAKAWHNWALFNAAAMEHYQRVAPALANRHVAPAISGFFRSIALGGVGQQKRKGGPLQDILRLLTLWFNHGAAPEVEVALMEGFGHVSIDTWLAVIPQIVARIHSNSSPVRSLIHQLLVRVGRQHPQALLYPLLVACKSQSATRRSAAMVVLDNLRQHSPLLVEQAQVVSLELIRVAILWHEAWHEALEEASQLYFGEQNVDGMLRVLAPLHHIIERLGAETMHEVSFVQAYGRELSEAHDWCQKYKETGREEELNQAWDLYYHVFKRINKQLPTLTTLELQYVSPRLLAARELELCVPGNYMPGVPGGSVTIAAFAPTMHVITSKQRPRRLQIHGSDGKDYGYLLKGHEDLRQDERVMQLFGLVNMLLNSTPSTATRDLGIARYAVVPLSPNSGLIGWVPNCDTLHALIREHRDAHKVPLNLEHRLMLAMAPDYDHLPLVNKVEVFEHALENTPGNDLARVLWLKSRSSETWLDRRTTYTRSLAVMSMVGYLLGLGDRHPSNLMLDRYSGKILHIDFGDCFEASMHREKFPERVPFRLTRMLVRAMEVSGIEGNFRSTCEGVMSVLRSNKDSVMAMLEAFVHDPLINWRLLNQTAPGETANAQPGGATPGPNGSGSGHSAAGSGSESGLNGSGQHDGTAGGPGQNARAPTPPPMPPLAEGEEGSNARSLNNAGSESGGLNVDANEVLNDRAVSVMRRMSHKLTGRDGSASSAAAGAPGGHLAGHSPGPGGRSQHEDVENSTPDGIEAQVQRLIVGATSHENLCQSYIGWCPFW